MNPRAVVLLSGGVDLHDDSQLSRGRKGYDVYALSFDYGQRHRVELERAKATAASLGLSGHVIVSFDLRQFGVSTYQRD